jgi:hypothetical protein
MIQLASFLMIAIVAAVSLVPPLVTAGALLLTRRRQGGEVIARLFVAIGVWLVADLAVFALLGARFAIDAHSASPDTTGAWWVRAGERLAYAYALLSIALIVLVVRRQPSTARAGHAA